MNEIERMRQLAGLKESSIHHDGPTTSDHIKQAQAKAEKSKDLEDYFDAIRIAHKAAKNAKSHNDQQAYSRWVQELSSKLWGL